MKRRRELENLADARAAEVELSGRQYRNEADREAAAVAWIKTAVDSAANGVGEGVARVSGGAQQVSKFIGAGSIALGRQVGTKTISTKNGVVAAFGTASDSVGKAARKTGEASSAAAKGIGRGAKSVAGGINTATVAVTSVVLAAVLASAPVILRALKSSGGTIKSVARDRKRQEWLADLIVDNVPLPVKIPKLLVLGVVMASAALIVAILEAAEDADREISGGDSTAEVPEEE